MMTSPILPVYKSGSMIMKEKMKQHTFVWFSKSSGELLPQKRESDFLELIQKVSNPPGFLHSPFHFLFPLPAHCSLDEDLLTPLKPHHQEHLPRNQYMY